MSEEGGRALFAVQYVPIQGVMLGICAVIHSNGNDRAGMKNGE